MGRCVCSHVCVFCMCMYMYMYAWNTYLTLPYPQLPDEFGALVNLEVLNLAGNVLEGPLHPSLFRDLVHLKECILSDNSFTGQIPDCFKDMKTLRVLDLSRNNFAGMHLHMCLCVESGKKCICRQLHRSQPLPLPLPPSLPAILLIRRTSPLHVKTYFFTNTQTYQKSTKRNNCLVVLQIGGTARN